MEIESIYDASSSEFDSVPDTEDNLEADSIAEQVPAEQEEQGSADSSEPDLSLDQEEQGSTDSSEPDLASDQEEQGSTDSSEPDLASDQEEQGSTVIYYPSAVTPYDDSSLMAVCNQIVDNTSEISNKLDNVNNTQMYILQMGLFIFGVVLAVGLGRWIYRITNL